MVGSAGGWRTDREVPAELGSGEASPSCIGMASSSLCLSTALVARPQSYQIRMPASDLNHSPKTLSLAAATLELELQHANLERHTWVNRMNTGFGASLPFQSPLQIQLRVQ